MFFGIVHKKTKERLGIFTGYFHKCFFASKYFPPERKVVKNSLYRRGGFGYTV